MCIGCHYIFKTCVARITCHVIRYASSEVVMCVLNSTSTLDDYVISRTLNVCPAAVLILELYPNSGLNLIPSHVAHWCIVDTLCLRTLRHAHVAIQTCVS